MLTGTADISEIDDPQSATPPSAPKTQTATVDDIDTESVKDPRTLVRRYAPDYGLDPDFAEKVADRESIHFKPSVTSGKELSPANAIGTMQLLSDTAKTEGVNPYNLHDNIKGGLSYLKKQIDEFGDQRLALAAYNAGPGVVRDFRDGTNTSGKNPNRRVTGGIPPFKETQDYVDAISPVQRGTATVDQIDSQTPTSGTATVDQISTEAPTVNVGAPSRPVVNAPTDSFDIRRNLPKDKPVADSFDIRKNLPRDRQITSTVPTTAQTFDALNNPGPGQEVSNITGQPIKSVAQQAQSARDFTTNQILRHRQADIGAPVEKQRLQMLAALSPEDKLKTANQIASQRPLTTEEQAALGISPHYASTLFSAGAREIDYGLAGAARLAQAPFGGAKPGESPSLLEEFQSGATHAAEQMQRQINREGVRGLSGELTEDVGALAPDIAGTVALPESKIAQVLYWGAVGGLKTAGRGGSATDIATSAATNAALPSILHGTAELPIVQRVLGSGGLMSTITLAQGGDLNAIGKSFILGGLMGIPGGERPPDDILAKATNSPELQEAVIEHAKNPSAETFDNVAKTAEKAGLDAYEAQKFATNVDSLKSASSPTPEGAKPAPLENTTTPISPKPTEETNAENLRGSQKILPEEGQIGAGSEINRSGDNAEIRQPSGQGRTGEGRPGSTEEEIKPPGIGQIFDYRNQRYRVDSVDDEHIRATDLSGKEGMRVFTREDFDRVTNIPGKKIPTGEEQRQSEVKSNEQATERLSSAPNFDHEVKTVSDALNDDNHPFSQALDRIAGGDTSDGAINAARTAATGLDESSVNDAIDGATRLANKQPTENPEPRTSENPAAQEGVGKSSGPVGIKNRITDAEREAQGQPPVDTSDQKRSFDQVVEAGKAAVDDGRINPGQLAERIAAKPRPLTPEETASLLYHKTQLLNHEDSIMKELRENRNSDNPDIDKEIDARGRLQAAQEQLDTARVASRKSGYEQGLGLAIRRIMMKRDYSLSRMIERAEAANKGKPISAQDKIDLEKLRDTIIKREEQYKEYDERKSKGEAGKTITEIRREASAERKAGRTVKRSTLDGEFASQKNALAKLFKMDSGGSRKGLGGPEAGAVDPELLTLPVEALNILRQMARNRLEAGLTTVDGVVDSIHEAVVDVMGGVTKRQIRDLISGYGKTSKPNPEALAVAMRELTAGMRDVSAEEDILSGKAPERSGYQRGPMTPEARARRQRINQLMREHGIEIERSGRSPEEQQKSALDGVKTRLKNAIDDLQRQIDAGEKPSKRTPVPRDEEAKALQAKRDDLAQTLQDINGPRKMTDAQRLDMAKGAAKKAIDEYQRRIDQKDFAAKQSGKVSDPELDALKAKRDALKTDYQKLADADPAVQAKRDSAKLDQLKTRMQQRLDSLKQQTATGNFYRNAQGKLTTSKPRVPFAGLDPEAQEIKANVEKAQDAADAKIKSIELANRSIPEKIMDSAAKIRRFIVLSSATAVEKLTAAGAARQISDPIESAIGGAISKTPGLRDIAAKAPREGAFKPSVEAQASALYIKKMLDLSRFKETLKTGKGKLDLIHGGKEYFDSDSKTDRILGFYNRLHAALKEPVKEAEFFRSTQYRTDQAIRQGLDVTDAKVRDSIAAQAYLDANRKVFMNPNFVTDAYTGAINKLQSSDRLDAKAMATVMKVLFPVVRVPTNYLAETSSYSPIGFAKAATTLLRKGIKDLSPEDADYVMRNLKKGLIGTAAMGIGAGLSHNFGGFYTQGNYSTPQDMKAGEIKVFGVNVPRLFLHHPLIEAMQAGATFAHLHNERQEGKLSSLFDTSIALSEEQPFIGETIRNVHALEKDKRAPAAGQLVGGLVTPPGLRRIANILDPKTPTSVMMKLLQTGGLQSADPMYRPPKTFGEGFESGLPSFIPYINRKNIPAKAIPPSRPPRPEKPAR